MISKNWLWYILVAIIVLGVILDYKTYDIVQPDDLEEVLYGDLARVTAPLTTEVFVADTYGDRRMRFYSGAVRNDDYLAPFIAGYRKHWLLNRYKDDVFLLIPDEDYIGDTMDRAPVTETYLYRYKVYHVMTKLSLEVERQFNYSSILRFAFLVFLIMNAWYRIWKRD